MEFRELSEDRSIQRPHIDLEDLNTKPVFGKGEFDVTAAHIQDGSAAGASGSGRIDRSLVESVDWPETQWGPVTLADATFRNVDVSNAKWSRVTAQRAEFVSCRATGWRVELTRARDMYFSDCRMDLSVIDIKSVKGLLVFERCRLSEAVISGNLSNVVFIDCDLDGAEFDASASRGCDLRESRLLGASGWQSMRGARITSAQMQIIAADLAEALGLDVS